MDTHSRLRQLMAERGWTAYRLAKNSGLSKSEMVELTPELKELFDHWVALTPEQKQAALQMIRAMSAK